LALDLEQLRSAARGARPASTLPAGQQNSDSPGSSSTGKWLVGICIVVGVLWWIGKSDKQPPSGKAPPSAGAPAREVSRCTLQLKTMTSKSLCATYWGSPSAGVCDAQIAAELSSRSVNVNDASCRVNTQATPQSPQNVNANVQSPFAQLAESHRGMVQIDETTTRSPELYSRSLDNLSSQISRSTRLDSPNDGTFIYSGVSVRPFSSVVIAFGANGCRQKFDIAGVCIQEARGLLCGSEIHENARGKDLCIVGLRR
jgi:hypothetical protein